MTHASANTEQVAFRGRGDTQALNSATFDHAQNTNFSQLAGVPFRIRLEVEEDAGAAATIGGVLEASRNGGTFFTVTPSSSIVRAVASAQFTDEATTTNVLTGSPLAFVTGRGSHDGDASDVSLTNQHTEFEFAIQIVEADVANGDTLTFRVAGLNVYTQVPSVTVSIVTTYQISATGSNAQTGSAAFPSAFYKVGSFAANTSTGNQVISGLGFRPKAIIFFMSNPTADGFANNERLSLGFTTGPTESYSTAIYSGDALNPSDSGRRMASKAITILLSDTGVQGEADLVSFDSNGFTINWTDAPNLAHIISFIAIGGPRVEAKVIAWDSDSSVTGVGFKPDVVLNASAVVALDSSASHAHLSFGVMDKNLRQWANAVYMKDAAMPTKTSHWQTTGKAYVAVDENNVVYRAFSISSMDADGFTVAWDAPGGQGQVDSMMSLCIKGIEVYASWLYKSSSTPQSNATLSFRPKAMLFASCGDGFAAAANYQAFTTFGATDGVASRLVHIRDNNDGQTSSDVSSYTEDYAIAGFNYIDQVEFAVTTPTFNSDGFTLAYNPNSGGTDEELAWLAFGEGIPSGHQVRATGSNAQTGSAILSLPPRPITATGSNSQSGSAALGIRQPISAMGSNAQTGSAALTVYTPPKFLSKVGSFSKKTSTGLQAITGLGFQPKAVILYGVGGPSGFFSGAWNFLGFTTGPTESFCVSTYSADNVGAANSSRRTAAKAISLVSTNEAVPWDAALSSFDADGFTLDWLVNNAGNDTINFIAIGGTDVQAKALSWASQNASGNISISGFGFQPDLVLHASTTPTASEGSYAGAYFGFGAMDKNGDQWTSSYCGVDAGTANTSRLQRTDSCLGVVADSESTHHRFTFVSMDPTGFTVNKITANEGTRHHISLMLKGLASKVGSFVKDTGAAPDQQSVTGVGFEPSLLLFSTTQNTAAAGADGTALFGLGAASDETVLAEDTFDVDVENWSAPSGGATVSRTTTAPKEGSGALQVDITAGTAYVVGEMTPLPQIPAGVDVRAVAYVKAPAGKTLSIKLQDWAVSGAIVGLFNFTGTGSWEKLEIVGGRSGGPSRYVVRIDDTSNTTYTFYVDKVRVTYPSRNIAIRDEDAQNPTDTQSFNGGSLLTMLSPSARDSKIAQAELVSFDTGGFSLEWDPNDAFAREVLYLALAEKTGNLFAVTATGTNAQTGSAVLRQALGITATGSNAQTGSASALTQRAAIAATGTTAQTGSAALRMTARFTATGTNAQTGSADIRTRAVLTATGTNAQSGSAALRWLLSVTATGSNAQSGQVAFGIVLRLTATGTNAQTGLFDATPVGIIGFAATGSNAPTGSASLRMFALFTATGSNAQTGQAALIMRALFTATGTNAQSGSADIRRTGVLNATGSNAQTGSASLRIVGAVFATGSNAQSGSASFTLIGRLAATGSNAQTGSASLRMIFSVRATGSNAQTGSAALRMTMRITATGSNAPAGSASFVILISPPVVGLVPISPQAPYRVVITDLNDNPLEEIPFSHFSYGFVLNDAGIFELTMPIQHPKATPDLLAPGQRHVHILRHGDLVWGGDLWYAGGSTNGEELRLQGEDWFSRLRRRHVDAKLTYEDMDQVTIAWNLIAWTQAKTNGALGITQGSTPATGVLRTRKLKPWNRQKIADLIQDLTVATNGFDFEITPQKVFNTYFPKKQEDNGFAFELGKNIESLSYDIDASNTVTKLSGMGAGSDRNRCIITSTNLGAQGAYGLLEGSVDLAHIKHYDNLADATKEELRLNSKARWQPQLAARLTDPNFDDFGVGDLIRVKAQRGFIDINEKFRAVGYSVGVDRDGEETVDVTFDQELVDLSS